MGNQKLFCVELRRVDGTLLLQDVVKASSIVLALMRALYSYLPEDRFYANKLRVAFASGGERARARLYPYCIEVYLRISEPALLSRLTLAQRRKRWRKRHGKVKTC